MAGGTNPRGEWHCRTSALSFPEPVKFSYVVVVVEFNLEKKKKKDFN